MAEIENVGIMKPDIFRTLEKWGDMAVKAGLVPTNTTVPQAMAIVQAGYEMGLQPLQSLRCMAFVRGRLCMKVE